MLQEKSAGLIIFHVNNDNVFFLLLYYGRQHWGFPKGNIEIGESEKAAAVREAKEETGLNSFMFFDEFTERIEYYYQRKGKSIHKEVIYFLAETEKRDVKLSFEHKGYKWLKFDDALLQLTFNNDKETLKRAYIRIKVLGKSYGK